MNPVTHLLTGWALAGSFRINRLERAFVTIAAIIPDIDGAGIIYDYLSADRSFQALQYWKYHHILGHNIGFCLLLCLLSFSFTKRRLITTLLVFISFHIHLLFDIAGSRGPDGYQWPIPYLLPFSDSWMLTWQGQWGLNAWQNIVVTLITGLTMLYITWKKGISPLEMVSVKASNAFVATIRKRFIYPHDIKGENI
jgi:inner membrane protein